MLAATSAVQAQQPETTAQNIYARSNLTKLQLLYWVGQKLRPDEPVFSNIFTYKLQGEVNSACFATAFTAFVNSHEAMRTVIEEVDDVPQRRVLDKPPETLQVVDLTAVPDPETALVTWLNDRSRRILEMSRCLYDSVLIKRHDEEYVWYLNMHHLITDATSFTLAFQQVQQLYTAAQAQSAVQPLKTPQFQKFVEYKHKYEASKRHDRAAAYWQKKLAQPLAPLHFFGRAPSKRCHRVHRTVYNLGLERSRKLRAAVTQKGIAGMTEELSLFNLWATFLFTHLHYLSSNQELAFVFTIHNRPTAVFQQIVGVLMELCVLRLEIDDDDSFLSLLNKTAQEVRETLIHYQYGSGAGRQNRAFEVMLNYTQHPALTFNDRPVEQVIVHTGSGSESFALHVHEMLETGNFELHFDFHEDLFTPEEREQAVAAFVAMVDAFLTDGDVPVQNVIADGTESVGGNGRSASTTPPRPYTGPRFPLESQLQKIWQSVLDIDSIGIHDNFFDLGGESWQAITLITEIEKSTGQYLPMAALLTDTTISKMAQRLQKENNEWQTIVTIKRGDPENRPFFFIPGAAGNTLVMERIARHLASEQTVYSFIMPGLVDDQEPVTEIEALAEYYLDAIQQAQTHGPYLLGGFSAGAVIALEAAQKLQAQGEKVELLVAIDMPILNPRYRFLRRFIDGVGAMLQLDEKRQAGLFHQTSQLLHKTNNFLAYNAQAKIEKIRQKTGRQAGTPDIAQTQGKNGADGSTDTLVPVITGAQLADPRLRHLFGIIENAVNVYVPKPYAGRVVLFRRDIAASPNEAHLGWNKVAANLETYVLPTDSHMGIVREPCAGILADKLQTALNLHQS